MPIQVEAISSWMSPWFQAKLWLDLDGMKAHASGVAQLAGVFEANPDQRLLAAPRGVSSCATPFIGSLPLGIHPLLLAIVGETYSR
jgi:hypothetical protein